MFSLVVMNIYAIEKKEKKSDQIQNRNVVIWSSFLLFTEASVK